MRTMTIPSPTMRRLKQAAAAARASQAAAPAPVLRRPAGDRGGGARGGPGRVLQTSPSSGKSHITAGGDGNGRNQGRVIRPAATPSHVSSNSSSGIKHRASASATTQLASGRAIRDPPPAAPAADGGGNTAAVAVGDRVLVRTPVTHSLAGQHVVITLGAVVVSVSVAEEDGDDDYLDVVFDGEFPPHDPSSTVRITWDQLVVSTPAARTKPPASGAASTTVPAPAHPSKREAGGSAMMSLRGAEQQRNLQDGRCKRSRY